MFLQPNKMFTDRKEAGVKLAERLSAYKNTNAIVLAIPRGGVPVGYEIATALGLSLDVVLAKKIGHPGNEEYAIGSVAEDVVHLDEHPEIPQSYIEEKTQQLKEQIQQRLRLFRGNKPQPEIRNRHVILTDDGIATGNTMLACIETLRKKLPAKIIVAVPVSPRRGCEKIRKLCDEFISLEEPDYFPGVGYFYTDFSQTEDAEVIRLLNKSA